MTLIEDTDLIFANPVKPVEQKCEMHILKRSINYTGSCKAPIKANKDTPNPS